VHVAEADARQAGVLGGGEAGVGLLARRRRQVVHLEAGVEGEQRVRDRADRKSGIKRGDEAGDLANLVGVDVAGHEERRGDEQRRIGPPLDPAGEALEVRQRATVRRAAQRAVQRLVPRLEVELDAAALRAEIDLLQARVEPPVSSGIPI
jgi:hypothetical protein